MGLDIYLRKSKLKFKGNLDKWEDVRAYIDDNDKREQAKLTKLIKRELPKVERAYKYIRNSNHCLLDYNDEYYQFVSKIRNLICVNFSFRIHPFVSSVLTPDELKEKLKTAVKDQDVPFYGYFRRNYLVVDYFKGMGLYHDGFVFCDREAIVKFVDDCEDLLKYHKDWKTPLVTTEEGRRYGYPDSSDFYDNVEFTIKEMKRFLKHVGKDEYVYIVFS